MTAETNKNEIITALIKSLLEFLDIEGEIVIVPVHEKRADIKITIQNGQQGYLIGKQGATLAALQHLVNLIARKEQIEIHYRLDSNDYQEERDQLFLKRVAEYVREKAESTELLLWPMSPYERRLVHEYFLQEGTHTTASEDFGSKRVVRVIKNEA